MEVQAEIAKAQADRENSAASGETIEYHFVGIRVNSKQSWPGKRQLPQAIRPP
jgi:hypothetical protein